MFRRSFLASLFAPFIAPFVDRTPRALRPTPARLIHVVLPEGGMVHVRSCLLTVARDSRVEHRVGLPSRPRTYAECRLRGVAPGDMGLLDFLPRVGSPPLDVPIRIVGPDGARLATLGRLSRYAIPYDDTVSLDDVVLVAEEVSPLPADWCPWGVYHLDATGLQYRDPGTNECQAAVRPLARSLADQPGGA